jgi:hypothetical protein
MCRLLASELHSRHAFALDCLAASYRDKGLLVRVLLTTSNGPVLATWHPCSRQHSVPKIRESGGLLGLSAGTLSWDPQLGLSAPQARAGSGCSTTAQQLPAACYRIPRISIDSFHQRPRQNWFPKGVVVLSCCHEPGHTDPCSRVRRVIRRREGKLGAEPTAGNPAM